MSVISAGNTTSTTLTQTGDLTGNLVFTTGGANTVALTLTNAQNVGIGTASPVASANYKTLTINGTNGGQIAFQANGATTSYLYNTSTVPFIFYLASSEAMRIDSAGNVGIGTNSPSRKLTVYDATASFIALQNSTSGNTSTDGFQLIGDPSAAYVWEYENLPMIFGTNATERMRIDSSGANVFVGGTTQNTSNGVVFAKNTSRAWVRFNGGTGSPLTIISSYNVSSVTRTALGKYVVNFTNALADANYCVVASSASTQSQGIFALPFYSAAGTTGSVTTSSFPILYLGTNGAPFDVDYCNLSVYD